MQRILILFISLLSLSASAKVPLVNIQVFEFIYTSAPFPSCHASTIVQLSNGDLLAAWFGGEYEGHPDVCIWTARKPLNATYWTDPQIVARGEKSCYNPVLVVLPGDEVLLFYKVGAFVQDWRGWLVSSKDNGTSWSNPQQLPDGFLGPIKNKPFIVGNQLLCPSSTEKGSWKIHFEIYDLINNTTHPTDRENANGIDLSHPVKVGPITANLSYKTFEPDSLAPIGCIQPSIIRLYDGSLQALCRTQNGRIATTYSKDNGLSWSTIQLTTLPNNNSGLDAVTLRDGRHLLAYNPIETPLGENGGPRSPLAIAISNDDGYTWQHLITLENDNLGEYSYPAIIEASDGTIHCTYTWRRQRIRHIAFTLED